jgi:chromosomal replication initiation ATPase DnaA
MGGASGASVQPRLFAFAMGERDPSSYVVTEANRPAVELLRAWRHWPGGAALLTGPKGSGRSHLGRLWSFETGAAPWRPDEDAHAAFLRLSGRLVVDDADHRADEEGLIRLFDLARANQGAVLFIAEETDRGWRPGLPDLQSRLAAAPRARLAEPDPVLLGHVLQRLCRDRFLLLPPSSASFLALRIERSFEAASAVAALLDQRIGPDGGKALSIPALRRVLGDMLQGTGEADFAPGDEDAPV